MIQEQEIRVRYNYTVPTMISLPRIGLVVIAISAAHAQDADQQATVPTATVYIYRLRVDVIGVVVNKAEIWLDGERFADLPNSRYWAVKLPVGEHIVSWGYKKPDESAIKMSMSADGVYYVRCEWVRSDRIPPFGRPTIRFSKVDGETATADLRRLKRGDPGQLKNHRLSVIP